MALNAGHVAAPRRIPKNYERIYAIFRDLSPGTHRTAHEVYVEARRQHPSIGVSTVYRGLARLRDLGLVAEIALPGAESAVYEKAGPSHAHFWCSLCGDVQDVPYEMPASVRHKVSSDHNARVTDISVTFHGTCAACSKAVAPLASAANQYA